MPEWTVSGYTAVRELGSGASGRVMLATHDETGTPVAVKYLSERLREDERFLAGFRKEAVLLGTLESPYVVQLYEYVETPQGAAIVMELADGIPLRTLLREEGATGPEAALTVLKGSLLGLAAAHAAGVVHRDYKPGNILVAADGSSRLVDFGIAVPSGQQGGEVAGTPVYMAPEQWTGQPAGPASDVYAATATFFECLTGARPYSGTTTMELAIQHLEAPIPDELAPEPVRPLIRSGLAKTPEERPATAADFVTELEQVATAAYGEDWEERGQRKLAALVALLPLLFPLYEPGASGTTALATTTLGAGSGVRRRRPLKHLGRILAGVTAGALLAGALTLTAAATGEPSDAQAISRATTGTSNSAGSPSSAGATSHTPSAGASATASASAKPSTSADASVPASASPSPSASAQSSADATTGGSAGGSAGGSPGGGTTGGSGGTPSTTATTAPATTAPPQLDVLSVAIQASGPLGSGCAMVVSVTVKTNGTADGRLTLTWFDSASADQAGPADGTQPITLPKGQTQVSGRYTHTFSTPDPYPYLGVQVSTNPAADSGNGSIATIAAPNSCNPIR